MVDKISEFDGKEQYECFRYTISKPGDIVICSKDLVKVIRGRNVVERIEAPRRDHKVYRMCSSQEQQSNWEDDYNKPGMQFNRHFFYPKSGLEPCVELCLSFETCLNVVLQY